MAATILQFFDMSEIYHWCSITSGRSPLLVSQKWYISEHAQKPLFMPLVFHQWFLTSLPKLYKQLI